MKEFFEKINSYKVKSQEPDLSGDFDQLPAETLLHVFSFLKPKELTTMRLVCKKTKVFSEDDSLWQAHCKSEPAAGKTYREEYITEQEALLYGWQTDPKFTRVNNNALMIKYVLVGDDDVKRKLVNEYRGDPVGFGRTLGTHFLIKHYTSNEQHQLDIQLWEMSSIRNDEEILRRFYLNNACCAIMVVNIEYYPKYSDFIPDPLISITKKLELIKNELKDNPNLVIAIIGAYVNESHILFCKEKLKQLATDNNISLCFSTNISCKEQIDAAFNEINEAVIKNYHLFSKKPLDPQQQTEHKPSCRMM